MTIEGIMFDDFFSRPIPQEGFEIDPSRPVFFGLIEKGAGECPELHGHAITMEGNVVPPELRPEREERN